MRARRAYEKGKLNCLTSDPRPAAYPLHDWGQVLSLSLSLCLHVRVSQMGIIVLISKFP